MKELVLGVNVTMNPEQESKFYGQFLDQIKGFSSTDVLRAAYDRIVSTAAAENALTYYENGGEEGIAAHALFNYLFPGR